MDEKTTKMYNYLKENLESLPTFAEKHAFLSETNFHSTEDVSINDIYEKFPGIKQQISDDMWHVIENEFGNPENPEFTLSKSVSDDKLLSIVDRMGLNTRVLESDLKSQGFPTNADDALEAINTLITEKNIRYGDASQILSDRKAAADAIYSEAEGFGTTENVPRGTSSPGLHPKFEPATITKKIFNYGLNVVGQPIEWLTRLGGNVLGKFGVEGYKYKEHPVLDSFLGPGEEGKINWSTMDYNPDTGRWGYPEEYVEATSLLTEAHDNLEGIKHDPKYEDAINMQARIKQYDQNREINAKVIKGSGYDEALQYLDMETLNQYLSKE